MLKTQGWRSRRLVMLLLAIMPVALPALGEDWRPIIGHGEETLGPADTLDDACLAGCQVTASGSGHATYLGSFIRLSCVTVTPAGATGVTEFIAANGDSICATVRAEPPSAGRVRGAYLFTGGTGRFSDVSGGAYFEGTIAVDDAGIHVAVDFAGLIQD